MVRAALLMLLLLAPAARAQAQTPSQPWHGTIRHKQVWSSKGEDGRYTADQHSSFDVSATLTGPPPAVVDEEITSGPASIRSDARTLWVVKDGYPILCGDPESEVSHAEGSGGLWVQVTNYSQDPN